MGLFLAINRFISYVSCTVLKIGFSSAHGAGSNAVKIIVVRSSCVSFDTYKNVCHTYIHVIILLFICWYCSTICRRVSEGLFFSFSVFVCHCSRCLFLNAYTKSASYLFVPHTIPGTYYTYDTYMIPQPVRFSLYHHGWPCWLVPRATDCSSWTGRLHWHHQWRVLKKMRSVLVLKKNAILHAPLEKHARTFSGDKTTTACSAAAVLRIGVRSCMYATIKYEMSLLLALRNTLLPSISIVYIILHGFVYTKQVFSFIVAVLSMTLFFFSLPVFHVFPALTVRIKVCYLLPV